jgi:hypothetical protein
MDSPRRERGLPEQLQSRGVSIGPDRSRRDQSAPQCLTRQPEVVNLHIGEEFTRLNRKLRSCRRHGDSCA